MTVLIVDYGMGNLASLANAIRHLGKSPLISSEVDDLEDASHVILPGQGAFKEGMQALHRLGWVEPLKRYALDEKKPLLGICLGMQLLADCSYEMEKTKGLGLIPGEVIKLKSLTNASIRLPHVGWNTVSFYQPSHWFKGLKDKCDFYFVHSYHYDTEDSYQLALTDYGQTFASMIGNQNILGVQCHPEKSAKPGRELLLNFLQDTYA